MKAVRSQRLVPPPRRPEDAPPIPPELYVEPENDIELLGEMLHDAATVAEMLRELPFDRTHYRGNLRIVLGAAVRMRDRCRKLLDPVEHAREAIRDAIDREDFGEPILEASMNVDEEQVVVTSDPAAEPEAQELITEIIEAGTEPILPHRQNGNGPKHPPQPPAKPPQKAHSYSIAESFIMSELGELGTASTTELVGILADKHGIKAVIANDALANLRSAKKIVTSRLGKGILNRLAV